MGILLLGGVLLLGAPSADAAVHVNGYYRKNGTYVQPYYRSNPDGNPYNNWSYPGNVNPYTGKVAPGNPDTYLKNYYGGSSDSPSYSGSLGTSADTPSVTCPLNAHATGSQCFCDVGYTNNGSECVSYNSNCQSKYGAGSYGDANYCYCSVGYQFNADKSYCITKPVCADGYVDSGGICVPQTFVSNAQSTKDLQTRLAELLAELARRKAQSQ